MTNIGMALKKIAPMTAAGGEVAPFHDININIFSDKYRKVRTRPPAARYILLWALLAVAIVLLFPLYQSLTKLDAENERLQTEFSNASPELNFATLESADTIQTENIIMEIAAATTSQQASDRALLANRGTFTRDLELVIGALPPSAYLTS